MLYLCKKDRLLITLIACFDGLLHFRVYVYQPPKCLFNNAAHTKCDTIKSIIDNGPKRFDQNVGVNNLFLHLASKKSIAYLSFGKWRCRHSHTQPNECYCMVKNLDGRTLSLNGHPCNNFFTSFNRDNPPMHYKRCTILFVVNCFTLESTSRCKGFGKPGYYLFICSDTLKDSWVLTNNLDRVVSS